MDGGATKRRRSKSPRSKEGSRKSVSKGSKDARRRSRPSRSPLPASMWPRVASVEVVGGSKKGKGRHSIRGGGILEGVKDFLSDTLGLCSHTWAKTALLVIDVQRDFCQKSIIEETCEPMLDEDGKPMFNKDDTPMLEPKSGSLACFDTASDSKMWEEICELQKMPFGFQVYTQDFHPSNHASFFDPAKPETMPTESGLAVVTQGPILIPTDKCALEIGKAASGDGVAFQAAVFVKQVMWPPHCVQETPGCELVDEWIDKTILTKRVKEGTAAVVQKATNPLVDSYSGFGDGVTPLKKSKWLEDTGLHAMLKSKGITHVVVCGIASDYCVNATAIDAAAYGFEVAVIKDACRGVAEAFPESVIEQLRATHKVLVLKSASELLTLGGCSCKDK